MILKDKSLESQVVSRAYRMGATENVFVEQLVSQHSVEELIVLMNKRYETKNLLYGNTEEFDQFESKYYGKNVNNILSNTEGLDNNKTNIHAKVRYLLSNVKLIRPDSDSDTTLLKRKVALKTQARKKAKSVKFKL